jgi:queuosine precursor transporter
MMKLPKAQYLFLLLGFFFLTNALLAEFVGVKIFSFEATLGLAPLSISLFGVDGLSLNMTAGVVLWPFVFVMTDIINEYYGVRGVRLLSYLAVVLILYTYLMVYLAMELPAADFWVLRKLPRTGPDGKPIVLNMDDAFKAIFGQGQWIIVGSLVAFLLGQLVDVTVFHWLRAKTGAKYIWLRATGSTLVSQFIDSFVVLFIAFYLSGQMPLALVLAIGVVNYVYKGVVAVLLTPLIYLLHYLIDRYLGHDVAHRLMAEAATQPE